MNGLEIKGRLDRIGKTTLEHFQDIKELEVADGTEVKVEDINDMNIILEAPMIKVVDLLPYKCGQVEKSLKALEIIKKKKVNVGTFIHLTKTTYGRALGKTIASKVMNELLQYKDLEEELGCPFEVIEKAIKNGIYTNVYSGICYVTRSDDYLLVSDDYAVRLSDYKKTWWLKEDKTE